MSDMALMYSLCDNELKTVQCLINVTLVSQADAFDEHCKTEIIIEVLPMMLVVPMLLVVLLKFCQHWLHVSQY